MTPSSSTLVASRPLSMLSSQSGSDPTPGVLQRPRTHRRRLSAPFALFRAFTSHGAAYTQFLKDYPGYALTAATLDAFRKREYTRFARSPEVYLDYMGGALYPESIVGHHSTLLRKSFFGNTHSSSVSSANSASYMAQARAAVLRCFNAGSEYTVVFTSNASTAIKLVGEAFPFSERSVYALAEDSHNSVHGVRRFASQAGARTCYVPAGPTGGLDESVAEDVLRQAATDGCSLFALTGQSNISNHKHPLSLLSFASSLGYHTLLDAAALAPTSCIDLTATPADAMVVSFYKMFGYPTGVGALIAKKDFLAKLKRPWFSGGTVDVVQVPGHAFSMAPLIHEQFEDGTVNYLSLPAIVDGLRLHALYLPSLPSRLSALTHYLSSYLSSLKHPSTGADAVALLSAKPQHRVQKIGEQSDAGSVISFLFLDEHGSALPLPFIDHAAAARNISLRTGCMCNPGGAAAMLNLHGVMSQLGTDALPAKMSSLETLIGGEVGVIRVSFGLASNFEDAWRFARWADEMVDVDTRKRAWKAWIADSGSAIPRPKV